MIDLSELKEKIKNHLPKGKWADRETWSIKVDDVLKIIEDYELSKRNTITAK